MIDHRVETTLLFIRHGESKKNLRDITGGEGDDLTPVGRLQAKELADRLYAELKHDRCSVISSEAKQAQQTAEIVADMFNTSVVVSKDLSPAGLGIAGGLTGEQIEQQYPDISLRLAAWHNRDIEANELNIEGMEPPVQFWNRILAFIYDQCSGDVKMIFCTRSVMVLVSNLVLGNLPHAGGGYKHMPIRHCDVIAFRILGGDPSHITVLYGLTTALLFGSAK